MTTAVRELTKVVTEPAIAFIDIYNKISDEFINSFSSKLNGGSVKLINSLPNESLSYDCLFFYTERYDRKIAENLAFFAETNEKPRHLLLVHENSSEKELLPYLTYSLNGIVSLDYLQEYPSILFQQIAEKGIFLEPCLHHDLIYEIEKRKLKDTPIEKLVLNREKVANILTLNEQDVLQLILEGYNNRKIAKTLYLAPSTVSTIISHLLRKIQANDRTDAMVKAIRNGWVDAQR